MKKLLLVLCLLIAGGAGGWMYMKNRPEKALKEQLADVAVSSGVTAFDGAKVQDSEALQSEAANALEKMAGLAIKGISLFQGNGGIEIWRLKASWAHIAKEGEVINVDLPVVRYALGDASSANPDADALDVKAKKGQLTDNQRFLTLWDDVVITRFADRLTGPKMTYDSKTRVMIFPDGAALEAPTAFGTARVFEWNLAENIMTATGNVDVTIKAQSENPGESDLSEKASSSTVPEMTPAQQPSISEKNSSPRPK